MSIVKIVAEIGINHNGDMKHVRSLINNSVEIGCHYIKFQKRTVEDVYTKKELDKPRKSPWGSTNREQKNGLELSRIDYDVIDAYCNLTKKIRWFASPWDVKSMEFLYPSYNLPYIKVASALLTDFEVLSAIKETGIPVIISTGMSTQGEVRSAINFFDEQVEYILACTSTYPTNDAEMNLSFITTLKKEFPKYRIGFSNHNAGAFYCCAAVAMGAEMIEYHITLDRGMYGSDQAASIELPGMRFIQKHVNHLQVAMGDGSWTIFDSEEVIRKKLRK